MEAKKEFIQNSWEEVYRSRQTKAILKWPVVGVSEFSIGSGEDKEKTLCLVIGKGNIRGLIPIQETGIKIEEDKPLVNRARLYKFIGQDISAIANGKIDVEGEWFIASRKLALEREAARTWPNLKEGMVVTVAARRIYENSVIVEHGGVEMYLPVYEISHGWVDEILDVIQPGDVFDVKIVRLDPEEGRVIVSLKALIPNPWPGAAKRYLKGGAYQGVVTGVVRYGVFVNFEPGVNALCNHLKTDRFKVEKGDVVAVMVKEVKLDGEEGRIRGSVVRVIRKNRAAS